MTRLTLGAALATFLIGPWSGCDRDPVAPPAMPPTERAPGHAIDTPAALPPPGGTVLLHDAHRRA